MRKVITSLILLMLFIINTAVIIHHDVPDEAYRALASKFDVAVDATEALPHDIDISTSPNGIVALPNSVHEDWIDEGFVKYTKIVAPNGKAIHFVAQDLLTDAQIVRSRNILQFFLTNFPSQYGTDKSAVANKMAENNATLALLNGTHIHGVNDSNVPAQDLFQNEIAVEGHDWYINNNFEHRDAAYEEILHLLQDTGFGVDGELDTQPGVLPAYQAEIRAAVDHSLANNLYGIDDPDYIEEISGRNQLTQEYLAAVVDTYYGLWAPWTEGDGAIWGIYIAKTREEIESRDPMGYDLMPKYFSPYINVNMDIDPSFNGIFNMNFNSNQAYTHKSQYLQHCTLTGTNASGLKGNDIDNELNGNSANNSLEGGKGNDQLDGKNGTDTAIFAGNIVDYTITYGNDNSVTVTDNVADRDGVDVLFNMESIQFADELFSI